VGAKQKAIIAIPWLLAFLMAFLWSFSDSIKVLVATSRHPLLGGESVNLVEPARTEFKRQEQKYFLEYGVYVPLEDIMYVEQLPSSGERYAASIKMTCADLSTKNGLAIWLPLRVKLPLLGERVFEWCWKPQVKS
jgi:hypothetical protein